MPKLKLELSALDYQTIQFCLKNTHSNYERRLDLPSCPDAFKKVVKNMELLIKTHFRHIINIPKPYPNNDDID